MALQRYYTQEWKPATMSESSDGCFDCNICLDSAHEPIVTLCGHLYCWSCIYKWLHVQSASLASDEHPQCPVCKADICHTAMVPLYARGQAATTSPTEEAKPATPHMGMLIPPRPSACGAAQALLSPTPPQRSGQRLPYRNPYQIQSYHHHQQQPGSGDFSGSLMGFQSPASAVGMFGGSMVYTRAIGGSDSVYAAATTGTYPNDVQSSSYRMMGSATPRLRRQEMQADKSLNRVSIFLFCCLLLCLIVF